MTGWHSSRAALLLTALIPSSACTQPEGPRLGQAPLPECTKTRPQVSRTYLAFFDQHSDHLTDRAKAILHEASASWIKNRIYNLEIYGHTDTSEVEPRDQGLGGRRAMTVKTFLLQAGIPERAIVERDFAATRPLVQTGPNRPEPQNRFVNFYFEVRGSVETYVNKQGCSYWLRKSLCTPLTDRSDLIACENTINYMQ